jgi:tetratricopeptide (TPR) repeat protein
MVVDQGCMKCMDCVSVCPNDALYFGFGKPALGVSKSLKKNYSLTWPEEFVGVGVFAASFFAVWDVYQLVPMLMALGIATVTTFLALRVIQLVRAADLSFYRFNLKSAGRISRAGWIFTCLALVWIGLNAHSGFIHYHESAGKRAFESIKIPDELALARTNPVRWLSASDRENINKGRNHFYAAKNFGLFANDFALPKLAWMEYLSGNNEQAVSLLAEAAARQSGQAKALSLYYRGAILNRLGRHELALASLEPALAERADLMTAREEKGEALWKLGRREEAAAVWNEAVQGNSGLPLAYNLLAGAAAATGKSDAAVEYQKQADRLTPPDPLFHWMLGLRLQNIGMNELAEKHFQRAIQLNPEFRRARS